MVKFLLILLLLCNSSIGEVTINNEKKDERFFINRSMNWLNEASEWAVLTGVKFFVEEGKEALRKKLLNEYKTLMQTDEPYINGGFKELTNKKWKSR